MIRLNDFIDVFQNRTPGIIGSYRFYSVLVPLVQKNDELHMLYEVRAETLKRQPGEICFPGGRQEPGETEVECAVRETMEELNLPEEAISVIGPSDKLFTYSRFTLSPILGIIDAGYMDEMVVNEDEVKEVFLVPVEFLLENPPDIYRYDVVPQVGDDFPYEQVQMKDGYNWRKGKTDIPIYQYQDKTIWGLTAQITYNIMECVKNFIEKK